MNLILTVVTSLGIIGCATPFSEIPEPSDNSVQAGQSDSEMPQASPSQISLMSGIFGINMLSNRCIDAAGAPGTTNGTPLQLYDCELNGHATNGPPTDQQWIINSNGFIQNALSGRCIDVYGAPGTANGARLQLWDCELSGYAPNGSVTDQQWHIRPDGFIQNVQSRRCIDVYGAPGTANGARLQLWNCELSGYAPNGSVTDQQWYALVPR